MQAVLERGDRSGTCGAYQQVTLDIDQRPSRDPGPGHVIDVVVHHGARQAVGLGTTTGHCRTGDDARSVQRTQSDPVVAADSSSPDRRSGFILDVAMGECRADPTAATVVQAARANAHVGTAVRADIQRGVMGIPGDHLAVLQCRPCVV